MQGSIDSGVPLDSRTDYDENTALHEAVRIGDINICNLIIKSGACLDYVNDMWLTPLHIAVQVQNFDICKLLLTKGVETLEFPDESGKTPLCSAVINGNIPIYKLLVLYGANIDGYTASTLDLAYSYDHETLCELLVEHGADLNFINEHGVTLPIINDNVLLDRLTQKKNDVNIFNQNLIDENHSDFLSLPFYDSFITRHLAYINYANSKGSAFSSVIEISTALDYRDSNILHPNIFSAELNHKISMRLEMLRTIGIDIIDPKDTGFQSIKHPSSMKFKAGLLDLVFSQINIINEIFSYLTPDDIKPDSCLALEDQQNFDLDVLGEI